MVDLAGALGASALVVTADRLSTINHTLLTLSALELAGIPCVGVVLTMPRKNKDPSAGSNADAIARLSGIDRIVSLRKVINDKAAALSIVPVIDWLGRIPAAA